MSLFRRGADGSARPSPSAVSIGLGWCSVHKPQPNARPHAHRQTRDALLPTYLYDAATPRRLTTPGHYAYVKIAEGCDYNCAFCIIPKLRGAYRSRDEASVVAEARALAARGVKELLLVSQDTTFYGIDRDRQDRGALGRLLRALNAIEGLEWIRLLYLYPTTITAETIDAMAACDKVVRYVDLPLQHASAAMLKRMRRPGTRRSYESLLANLRHALPGVTLRTTFVVGFPGETEADVDELVDFIKTIEFDHVGVFTYSHEEGTAAAAMDDDVPAAVKRKRQRRVMQVQQRIVARRQKARVGQRVRVVVDGPSKEHELVLQGRLPGQAPDVDPVVFFTDCDPTDYPAGTFVDAEIVDAAGLRPHRPADRTRSRTLTMPGMPRMPGTLGRATRLRPADRNLVSAFAAFGIAALTWPCNGPDWSQPGLPTAADSWYSPRLEFRLPFRSGPLCPLFVFQGSPSRRRDNRYAPGARPDGGRTGRRILRARHLRHPAAAGVEWLGAACRHRSTAAA